LTHKEKENQKIIMVKKEEKKGKGVF